MNIKHLINKIVEGDCLDVMAGLPDSSVDMILCDLPYGTTRNKWDSVIDLKSLWYHYDRIIKENGVIALTAQGLFTARLIMSNPGMFRYKVVWIKSKAPNFLSANRQPLRKHEDICIFYKAQPTYNPQMTKGEAYDKGTRKDRHTSSYGAYKPKRLKYDGMRFPYDVVFYEDGEDYVYFKTAETEGAAYHPTQKPVELGRYLIRTYTNPGDVVLDNACGSGSFLVSAVLEDRDFIGIEKNEGVLMYRNTPVDCISTCLERINALPAKTPEYAQNNN